METTLQNLVDLLVEAIPTIIFFIVLTFYLKYVFFRPIARIMEERRKATEGVRELARKAYEEADKKTSEFEKALNLARAELHQEHEKLRQQWAEEQTAAIAKARANADRQIEEAKRLIAQEVEQAQTELNASVDPLSEEIVSAVAGRRAA